MTTICVGIAALFIGVFIGVFVMCLCHAASEADRHLERH